MEKHEETRLTKLFLAFMMGAVVAFTATFVAGGLAIAAPFIVGCAVFVFASKFLTGRKNDEK